MYGHHIKNGVKVKCLEDNIKFLENSNVDILDTTLTGTNGFFLHINVSTNSWQSSRKEREASNNNRKCFVHFWPLAQTMASQSTQLFCTFNGLICRLVKLCRGIKEFPKAKKVSILSGDKFLHVCPIFSGKPKVDTSNRVF